MSNLNKQNTAGCVSVADNQQLIAPLKSFLAPLKSFDILALYKFDYYYNIQLIPRVLCLQCFGVSVVWLHCFDFVGWSSGRASGL